MRCGYGDVFERVSHWRGARTASRGTGRPARRSPSTARTAIGRSAKSHAAKPYGVFVGRQDNRGRRGFRGGGNPLDVAPRERMVVAKRHRADDLPAGGRDIGEKNARAGRCPRRQTRASSGTTTVSPFRTMRGGPKRRAFRETPAPRRARAPRARPRRQIAAIDDRRVGVWRRRERLAQTPRRATAGRSRGRLRRSPADRRRAPAAKCWKPSSSR